MSRRHNSSRRRQYGRRQHEVRERRTGSPVERVWQQAPHSSDWQVADRQDDRTSSTGTDAYGADAYGADAYGADAYGDLYGADGYGGAQL